MRHLRFHGLSRALLGGLLLTVLVAGLAGCGGKKKAKISGKVTYKGNPVTGGTLTLYPPDEKQAPLPIQIQADGTFVTTDVTPGTYQVGISTESAKRAAGPDMSKFKPPPGVKVSAEEMKRYGSSSGGGVKYMAIPPKYAKPETSGLTWEIKGGSQDKPFPLE